MKVGAAVVSGTLNKGLQDRPWSVALLSGFRLSSDGLHATAGAEVARKIGGDVEAFVQAEKIAGVGVEAAGGLRWRF